VADVYLPLSRLLNLYVAATQDLHRATDTFLGSLAAKVPFVIGIAGSVAVGKSTTSRILQALLSRWPDHPRSRWSPPTASCYPNAELERAG
jgi:type I pantothenate kinase